MTQSPQTIRTTRTNVTSGATKPGPYDIVVPTVGRPCLARLLDALVEGSGPPPDRIVIVDDRTRPAGGLLAALPCPSPAPLVHVVTSGGQGPAAARNAGWRATTAPWVAFLDDDIVPDVDWATRLSADIAACGPTVAATQGRLTVPSTPDRAPTDWERNVTRLAHAPWATADMAYRRSVLEALGGFDERFPRAYREDADLGLRVTAAGYRIVKGSRHVTHPVGPAPWYVSIVKQAGNVDDALMDRLHGSGWRRRAGSPRGQRRRHLVTAAAGVAGLAGLAARRKGMAAVGIAVWLAGTGELAWRRIRPGPRTSREIATMAATSLALPAAATAWWLWGLVRAQRLASVHQPRQGAVRAGRTTSSSRAPGDDLKRRVEAVIFDRDGTLVVDVPHNGDPARVLEMPDAEAAVDRLRRDGLPVAVATNQSGVARRMIDPGQVSAVNARIDLLLGPFDAWFVCPHDEGDGCDCRKPSPGLILKAAAELGVDPACCVVIGDTGADVEAALAAGALPILVPTAQTRVEEITTAPVVAHDLASAVDLVLRERKVGR